MKRVFIETYGCQMNVADSELVAGVLERAGLELAARPEDADAVLVNTCAIREHAEQRVLGRLSEFVRLKARRPGLVVGVTGCMAQHLRGRLLDRAGVLDLVVGPDAYRDLPALLERAAREPVAAVRPDRDETYGDLEPKREPGVRAWVTVQRGCDKFCAFCVVPFTRGRERSLPLADILRAVRRAVAQGYREIVFLGQAVNAWHDGDHDFADLLRAAREVEGVARIRYTSPHPSHVHDRLVEVVAEGGPVCPHLHLPFQSASDRVLEAMNRSYTIAHYREVVARLRAAVPELALSTDVIVGFPGETDDDFRRTEDYLREARFDSAFLFKYSARPDTRAYAWKETVPEEEKGRRLTRLIELQHAVSAAMNDRWIGREVEVLVEGPARRNPEQLYGRTAQYKAIVFPNDGTPSGTLRRLRVAGATLATLFGAPLSRPAAATPTIG
jgi:tRNA-2-methylthio-N6-dimethylallyladenosine synthase